MPAVQNNNGKKAPAFLGLQSYNESQAGNFFGRDDEISKLTTLLQVNTLTIVFGKSGTGKTSLLNAGVFPRLRKNFFLPFRIRLEINEKALDLVSQVKKALQEEIEKKGFKVQSYPGNETLWEYFHKEPLWQVITPILVFDQFEEIFTLAKQYPKYQEKELPALWTELSDLIENNIPEKLSNQPGYKRSAFDFNYKNQKTKVVFAFREEYLPEFETVASKIPSIKSSRFRLMPMNGHQAYDVITKNWKEKINKSEADNIIRNYLTKENKDKDYDLMTVEPSLLSQVCVDIDKKRIEAGSNAVSEELLRNYPQKKILREIYDQAMTAANAVLIQEPGSERGINSNRINEFVEDKLINQEGFRTRHTVSDDDTPLKPGIAELGKRYFIREDNNVVELTHDVLTPLIKSDREKRMTKMAITKRRKRVLLILFLISLLAMGSWIIFGWKAKDAIVSLNKSIDSLDKTKQKIHVADSLLKYNDSVLIKVKDSIRILRQIGTIGCDCEEIKESLDKCDTSIQEKIDSIRILKIQIIILNDTILKYKNLIRNRGDIPTGQVAQLTETIKELQERINNLITEKEKLEADNLKLRIELEQVRKELQKIKIELENCRKILSDVTFSGKIQYDKQGIDMVKPADISMYLIPIEKNRKLAKRASVYEINCYDKEIMEGVGIYKTKTDKDGNFAFRGAPDGQYLLKICAYYGGFYKIDLKDGNRQRNFNASPPVSYPYTN